MLVPAGVHVVGSCGFCFAGPGVAPGWAPGVTPGVLPAQLGPSCMHLRGAFVGSVLFGVHVVVSCVDVFLFCGHWGAPGVGPWGSLQG